MSIQSKLQNIQMSVTKRNSMKKSCWFVSRLAYFYYRNVINFQQTCQIQSKLQNIQMSVTKRNCLKKSCWFVSRLAYFYYGNVINFQQTCQIQSKLQNIQISGTKRKYERSEQIFKTVTFSWVVYLSHQPFLPLCFRWNCFGWSKWIPCNLPRSESGSSRLQTAGEEE